ncbi:MAG TPA: SIS domain-containing protein [Candidatus Cybelea sp.]|nr:SIS domain-containing protein [Candidatus Cybelea sp.]
MPESQMRAEALESASVVARMLAANRARCVELAARLKKSPPPFAVTCARGSSDNAGTYAKYLLEIRQGLVTSSVGPSVSSVFGVAPRMAGALFLAISQSGRSPDLLSLTETARKAGALTVALVNDADSPLAKNAEIMLPLLAGPERSVAATKSYVASLAAILQIIAHWSDDANLHLALERLPEDLERAADLDWSAAEPVLRDARNLFVIGRGPGFGIAQEGALKLKEICGLHAEAMSSAELMHGPLALPGPDFPVMAFLQPDRSESGILKILRGLASRGVPVVAAGAGDKAPGAISLPHVADADPFAAPILLIQSFYLLVERLAWARGRDPDRPPYLRKVTETV